MMRIGIIGAGGVGGYYGGVLARAGHAVRVLARGATLDALRARGLEVRTPGGSFTVPVEAVVGGAGLRGVELAVVAVKAYSLDSIVPAAREAAEGGAAVLPLLNGVEAADRLIAAGVPEHAVLGGATYLSAARVAPGVVERRSPFQRVLVGELDGPVSPRVSAVVAAFGEAGVDASGSAEIRVELWRKLVFLAAISAACGMARADIGAVRERPLGGVLLERLVRETAAVARARGAALPRDEEERVVALLAGLPGSMRPSFLLDVLEGGPTELDSLSGAVSRLARECGVEVPCHDTALTLLSA